MTAPVNFYADFKGLAALKKDANAQDPKALRETARQFEGLFTQMMLKTMRQASSSLSGGDALMGNDQSDMYREMFDNQIAMQLAKGRGIGLAEMLVRQLGSAGTANPAAPTNATIKMPGAASKAPTFDLPREVSAPMLEIKRLPEAVQMPLPKSQPASSAMPANAATEAVDSAAQNRAAALDAVIRECEASTAASMSEPVQQPTASPEIVEASEPMRPQPLAKSAADFVRQLWPHAQKAARELGVDAKTLIAHAALETGWGKFVPCNPDGSCSFNLFGIKANSRWQGQSVAVNTLEFEDGVAVKKQASFRSYDSPADSFRDYATFIKNSPRYAAAVGAGDDAAAFATALQQGGYATDPNYATKLTSVAARMDSIYMPTSKAPLKLANNVPLSTGRSVSTGGET